MPRVAVPQTTIPQSIDAEQSVLGAMLQEFGAWEAAQPLKAAHFFDYRNAKIYLAISKLVSQSKEPEPVAVGIELGADLDECAGLEYLEALKRCTPSAKNTAHYARIIRDKATERGILAFTSDIPGILAQDIKPHEKLDAVLRGFETLANDNIKKKPKTAFEIGLDVAEYYAAMQRGEIEPGHPTHIPALDSKLGGGLSGGNVIVLAARPSVGKSSFAAQIGLVMAGQGLKTLFLSMEMSQRQIVVRMVCNLGRVNYGDLRAGKLTDDGWSRYGEALEKLKELPFEIDDQAALTLMDIKTKVRSCKGVRVIIVDYIQLMEGEGDNRNAQIEVISRGLKQIAKDHNAIVIVLSQLNRKVEDRANKKPVMSDLKDSGAIEQDADVIIFLWPVRDYGDGRKLVGVSVAKNREGETGDFAMQLEGKHQIWGESTDSIETYEPKTVRGGFKN